MKINWSKIIQVLATIIILVFLLLLFSTNIGSPMPGGKDERRMADLRQTQNALELYYHRFSSYPNVDSWSDLKNSLINAEIGISTVSNDPNYPNSTYFYGHSSDNQHYVLKAILENKKYPALKNSAHGTIYGLNCDSPAYCVKL